jgi:hypothetical protein
VHIRSNDRNVKTRSTIEPIETSYSAWHANREPGFSPYAETERTHRTP